MRAIRAGNLTKVYGEGENRVEALAGVAWRSRGAMGGGVGPSGAGRARDEPPRLLDRPTSGSYVLDGREVSGLRGREVTKARRNLIGFVFQSYNLSAPPDGAFERGTADDLRRGVRSGAQEAGAGGP